MLYKIFNAASLGTQVIESSPLEYKPACTIGSLLNDTFLINRADANELFNSLMIYPLGGVPLILYEEFTKRFGFKEEVIKVFIR
jgi:hypothetical protein